MNIAIMFSLTLWSCFDAIYIVKRAMLDLTILNRFFFVQTAFTQQKPPCHKLSAYFFLRGHSFWRAAVVTPMSSKMSTSFFLQLKRNEGFWWKRFNDPKACMIQLDMILFPKKFCPWGASRITLGIFGLSMLS